MCNTPFSGNRRRKQSCASLSPWAAVEIDERFKRKGYFDAVDVDEIERQLGNIVQEDDDDPKRVQLEYQLPEREVLVRCFFGVPANLDEGAALRDARRPCWPWKLCAGAGEAPRAIALQEEETSCQKYRDCA